MSVKAKATDRDRTSRRNFLKTSAAAGAVLGGGLSIARSAHAQGSDAIRIALIGCGGRGTGAAVNALQNAAHPNVKLVALADAFEDRMENCLKALHKRCKRGVDVPKERMFSGFVGYQKAIDCGVDMVLLCTPPGFRPMQFEAAVKAGKHVFMEKPVAVDAPGIRKILAANEEAKKKNLAVAVGLNMRHNASRKAIVERLREGVIGKILYMRAYRNGSGAWVRSRQPGQTEMEYQIRNWYNFTWLSGDPIVEGHIHELDLINWMKDAHPVEANGMGGRQVRTGADCGEIFDHHAVEYEYSDGSRLFSFRRSIPGCWNNTSVHAHGTKGYGELFIFVPDGNVVYVDGQEPLRWKRANHGHQVEHDDLFAALLAGEAYNEGDYGATSTMTAILGRMATYSGKVVTWDEAINSNLDLSPKSYTWDAEPPVKPGEDGIYPCAMPGVTKAW